MKISCFSLLFILIINGCQSSPKPELEKKIYPKKEYFSVSENDYYLDTLLANHKRRFVEENKLNSNENDVEFNSEVRMDGVSLKYITGKFHFLIMDSTQAFVLSRATKYLDIEICGNSDATDSIREMKSIHYYLDSIQPIQLTRIPAYLKKNEDKIIEGKENRNLPALITFSLKNDTLKGSFIHDILDSMEKNRMNHYLIRRMNEIEMEAVDNYSKKN
jgi:hypothetical protein